MNSRIRWVGVLISMTIVGASVSVVAAEDVIYPMLFPVAGPVTVVYDNFGDPRPDGRTHEGVDIMSPKMTPVIAVTDGVVEYIGGECCYMAIRHDDGWGSAYIHLNNDTPGTDDGLGWGIAPGLEVGSRVIAGQLIGWVGDSGNAENVGSHLHFELWPEGGGWHSAIDAYPSLMAAPRLTEPGGFWESPCPVGGVCDTVMFRNSSGLFRLWETLSCPRIQEDFYYGKAGDVAFSGDWDGDGVDTPGLYRQSDGYVYLRNSNDGGWADFDYFFGRAGDVPVAGDFDGDGFDTVSVYRPSEGKFFIMNELGDGWAETEFVFGRPGDVPFVGDFDGDGYDTIGLHRPTTGFAYFRNELSEGWADTDFFYGKPGDRLTAGDWDGNGTDTVAVYRPSTGMLYIKLTNEEGWADIEAYGGIFADILTIRACEPIPES